MHKLDARLSSAEFCRRRPRLGRIGLLLAALAAVQGGAAMAAAGAATTAPKPRGADAIAPRSEADLLLLAAPVPGARLTSSYGWRVHPILKVRRFHKGVDYAAPKGTPVHAAQDGVVEDIGWRGHYGLYLRIRHPGGIETGYAHLAAFTPQLHQGSPVSRGQIVGSVGATGWSTGPHLFYEVMVDGGYVDPLRTHPPQPAADASAEASAMPRETPQLLAVHAAP